MTKGNQHREALIFRYGGGGIVFILLCCFLVGVGLFYSIGGVSISYIGGGVLAVVSAFFIIPQLRSYSLVTVFGFVCIGVGQLYGVWYEHIQYPTSFVVDGSYEGIVSSSPRLYDSYQFFIMDDESGASIGLFTSLDIGVLYGDRLVVEGDIEYVSGDTSYLKARGVDYVLFFPRDISVFEGEWSVVRSMYMFRDSIVSSLRRVLPSNEASFAAGTIIGRDSVSFSDNLVEQLIGSGIIHVVALSGYNVSILVFIVALLLRSFLSRRSSVLVSLLCIWIFVFLVGAEASVVRAAAMASIALLGGLFSRPQWQWYIMVVVAVGMVLFNPSIIVYDMGFLLSFAALWGILYCAPRLIGLFYFSSSFLRGVWRLFVETFSAQVGALPILLFFFSSVSLGGLVANIFILPLIPFVMLGAFVVGVGGIVSEGIGFVGSYILSLLIDVSLLISSLCAGIGIIETSFPFIGVIGYYTLIVWVMHRYLTPSSYNRIIL